MFSLSGKVAVVTGGGSGIGEAIVRRFTEAGAVVFLFDRDEVNGRRVAGETGASFLSVDVSDEAAVAAAGETVRVAAPGYVSVLVNNAGVGHVGTVLSTTAADLDRLYAINVRSVMFMTRAFLPPMLEARRGSVVNLASIGGVVGIRERFGYCATKFAVAGMTRCMALDHAASGVRFNAICPGRVETPFVTARLAEYPDPAAARKEMTSTQALARMADPAEIAAAAHYLASDESAFITGTDFIIDGGWTAGK